MVSAASKKLLKELPTPEEMKAILFSLHDNADEASALISAAYLDRALELTLLASFTPLNADEKKRLFDASSNGILGSMTAKSRMAYAAKLISRQTYEDLMLIIGIRNAFAHSLHVVDFDNAHIKTDCATLKSANLALVKKLGDTAKMQFYLTVLAIYLSLRNDILRLLLPDAPDGSRLRIGDAPSPSHGKQARQSRRKGHRRTDNK
jgi:putative NIF3 family GTP cyclohydrolase 1 type 2